MGEMFVGFTLEAKLVSSKRFIPVHCRKHGFTLVDKVYYLKFKLPTIFRDKKSL